MKTYKVATQSELDVALKKIRKGDVVKIDGGGRFFLRACRGNLIVVWCEALDARYAKIGGDLDARYAKIGGDLYARDAKIGGDLYARDAEIGGDLYARDAEIGGDLDARDAEIGGDLYACHAEIAGIKIGELTEAEKKILKQIPVPRLNMSDWHGYGWEPRKRGDCGTTHCLAGWAQALSIAPEIRQMDALHAGRELLPNASHLFFAPQKIVEDWLCKL